MNRKSAKKDQASYDPHRVNRDFSIWHCINGADMNEEMKYNIIIDLGGQNEVKKKKDGH